MLTLVKQERTLDRLNGGQRGLTPFLPSPSGREIHFGQSTDIIDILAREHFQAFLDRVVKERAVMREGNEWTQLLHKISIIASAQFYLLTWPMFLSYIACVNAISQLQNINHGE